MSIVYVMFHFRYSKKNMNEKSSTKDELLELVSIFLSMYGWLCFCRNKDTILIIILFFVIIRAP